MSSLQILGIWWDINDISDCFFKQSELNFALQDYLQALELDESDTAIATRISVIYNEFGVGLYQDKKYTVSAQSIVPINNFKRIFLNMIKDFLLLYIVGISLKCNKEQLHFIESKQAVLDSFLVIFSYYILEEYGFHFSKRASLNIARM